jgi:hypothetical protein
VTGAVPATARLSEFEYFRDPDLGDAMVGVLLVFSTGHLFQISVPAGRNDDAHEIAACIAAATACVREARAAVGDALSQ